MKEYESMFLVNPELDEEGVEKVKQKVESVISGKNGEVEKWEIWGRRRLAYKIGVRAEAIYLLLFFRGESELVSELKKMCRLNTDLMQYMFLRKN